MKKKISMKTITSTILFILIALCLTTCDKNTCENCYPTVFECKVNGEPWKTSCESKDGLGCNALDVQLYKNYLSLHALNNTSNQAIYLISSGSEITVGNNKLFRGQNVSTFYNDVNNFKTCGQYLLDSNSIYVLKITKLDTVNQIIQGSFNLNLQDSCNKLIEITQGKFDVIYRN